MVYRDDPDSPDHDDGSDSYASSSGGSGSFEISKVPQYRDDPSSSSPDGDEYNDVESRPPAPLPSSSAPSRLKPLLGICLVVALVVGGYKLSNGGHRGSDGSSISDAPSKPLFTGSKTGVRGKSNNQDSGNDSPAGSSAPAGNQHAAPTEAECVDSSEGLNGVTCQTYLGSVIGRKKLLADRCSMDTGVVSRTPGVNLLVKDFCRLSCGVCEDGDDDNNDAQSAAAQPSSGNDCEDDASFVHTNGKMCKAFDQISGKPQVKSTLCSKDTGRKGENGEKLLVQDFCRLSCGTCEESNSVSSPTMTIAEEDEFEEELKEDLEEIECEDDASFIHTTGKRCEVFGQIIGKPDVKARLCSKNTGRKGENGQNLLVQDFCRLSCDVCEESNNVTPLLTATEEEEFVEEVEEDLEEIEEEDAMEEEKPVSVPVQPAKPKHTTSLPKPSEECEDDDTYVHTNLKTCATFIANVGRPALHESRCSQVTGIFEDNGKELLMMDFCKKSCDNCKHANAASAVVDAAQEEEGSGENEEETEAADAAASSVVGAQDEEIVEEHEEEDGEQQNEAVTATELDVVQGEEENENMEDKKQSEANSNTAEDAELIGEDEEAAASAVLDVAQEDEKNMEDETQNQDVDAAAPAEVVAQDEENDEVLDAAPEGRTMRKIWKTKMENEEMET